MHWETLPRPKFTAKEIAACKYIEETGFRPWLVDLLDKTVTDGKRRYKSLVEFAMKLGWNSDCK